MGFSRQQCEWFASSIFRGFSQSRDQTRVSCTVDRFFTDWAIKEVQTLIRPLLFSSQSYLNFLYVLNFFTLPNHPTREGNGTHSSTLAWKIIWTEEHGRLQSMGSLRVRHNWATSCITARRSNQSILKVISPEYSLEGLILRLKLKYFGHLMWRIGTFELWCWRLLRVPWIARRSKQSILKEISPEYSLEGLMLKLKLKLQYFGHLIGRADSLEKTLMLRKIESKRKRGQQRMRWLDSIINSVDMNLIKLWETVEDGGA